MLTIVIGSGKNRKVVTPYMDKVSREKVAEDIKNYLFRPALLNISN